MLRRHLWLASAFLVLVASATPAAATDIFWNSGNGLFGDGTNWTGGIVPGASDTAIFPAGFGPFIDFDQNFTVGDVVIDPAGIFNFQTVGPVAGRSLTSNNVTVRGELNLGNGLGTAFNTNTNDTLLLHNGLMRIENGSRARTQTLSLFSDGGGPDSNLGVFGGGLTGASNLSVLGNAQLDSSNGFQSTLHVFGGADASIAGELRVANNAFAFDSRAAVNVSFGGRLSSGNILAATTSSSSQQAEILVQDAGSRLVQENDAGLWLGSRNGTGAPTVKVTTGGEFVGGSGGVHVGANSQILIDDFGSGNTTSFSTTGDVNIATDGGVAAFADSLRVAGQNAIFWQHGGGNFTVGNANNGGAVVRVDNGARMELDAVQVTIHQGSSFRVDGIGSTATTTGKVAINPGILNGVGFSSLDVFNDGQFTQTGSGGVTVGVNGNSAASALTVGSGGRYDAGAGTVTVNSTGRIEIFDGAFVTSGNVNLNTAGGLGGPGFDLLRVDSSGEFVQTGSGAFTIGSAANQTDMVIVTNNSSFTTGSGDLTVHSSGVLNVSDFGFPGTQAVIGGNVAINPNGGNGSNGRITVDGSNAQIVQNADTTLTVGSASGNGRLEVLNGGSYTTGEGLTKIGKLGVVDVSGALLLNGDTLVDGGQLNIIPGGTINAASGTQITVQNGGTYDRAVAGITRIANQQLLHVKSGGRFLGSDVLVGDFVSTGTLLVEGTGSVASAFSLRTGFTDGSGTSSFRSGGSGDFAQVSVGGGSAFGAQAALNVESGARVEFDSLNVGGGFTSENAANVVVTGSGSRLQQVNPNFITLGSPGGSEQARLSVNDGGQFVALTPVDLFQNSTFVIDGGNVSVPEFNLLGGAVDFRSGSLAINSSFDVGAAGDLGNNINLSAGKSLSTSGPTFIQVDGQVSLTGGSLVADALDVVGGFDFQSGTVTLTSPNSVSIGPQGKMVIADRATFTPVNPISNSGELFLGGPGAAIAAGNQIDNFGVIRGNGSIQRSVKNQIGGEIRSTFSDRLLLAGAGNRNDGVMTLSFGGTIESPQRLENTATGVIAGDGILRVGQFGVAGQAPVGEGLINFGRMNFSGDTQIFGDVWIEGGDDADVIASGGATVTFFDDAWLKDTVAGSPKPEIRAGTNSTVVYFGLVKGSVNLTGSGEHSIEGILSPGFSPGHTGATNLSLQAAGTFAFDLAGTQRMSDSVLDTTGHYSAFDISNTLTLNANGTIDVNLIPIVGPNHDTGADFAPSVGDSFELIQYAALAGDDPSTLNFNFDQAQLGSGLAWEIDWGPSTGGSLFLSVVAVPEPSAYLLAFVGIMVIGLFARMRRSRRP